MRKSEGLSTTLQTGHVHLLFIARILALLSRYAPRPKHCKCTQCSPRTGVWTRSKDKGHRSLSLFEMTIIISSSSCWRRFSATSSTSRSAFEAASSASSSSFSAFSLTFFVGARREHTRARASSSLQTWTSAEICSAERVCVRTSAIANAEGKSSSMDTVMAFIPGFKPAEMFMGMSRRTWPSSGSKILKTSKPLTSRLNLRGQTCVHASLSTFTMRINTEWSSLRHNFNSGRSMENEKVGLVTMWQSNVPNGSMTALKGSICLKRHTGHENNSGDLVNSACCRS
mmetsp:Transcript_115436/g.326268  ORF Transcript_115436/g.326268 Transcript_115436/m.326268 type:complete len:285 (+) Transcript_115436:386-1240(+)